MDSRRLTYLLRPNVTRPDRHAASTLYTPPVTDLDYTSHEHESDVISEAPSDISDIDIGSDTGLGGEDDALSAIDEGSVAPGPAESVQDYDESWSIVGDTDAEFEGDESASEILAQSIDSLSIQDPVLSPELTADATFRARHSPLRSQVWEHRQGRSASSPSRSPSRRPVRRIPPRLEPPVNKALHTKSFYDYLYA